MIYGEVSPRKDHMLEDRDGFGDAPVVEVRPCEFVLSLQTPGVVFSQVVLHLQHVLKDFDRLSVASVCGVCAC